METALDPNVLGFGYATQADAFQCGREAAQAAKNQLKAEHSDFALAFGPNSIQFSDFMEGVRLVIGNRPVIGIPADPIASNATSTPQAAMVLLLRGTAMRFAFAAARPGLSAAATAHALFGEFRSQHGTLISSLPHRHLFFFMNRTENASSDDDRRLAGEGGFESSTISVRSISESGPFVSTAAWARSGGWVGVECLAARPWGLGVARCEDPNSPKALQIAAVNAYTQAMHRMGRTDLLTGLFFVNGADSLAPVTEILNDLGGAVTRGSAVPLIAAGTAGHSAYAGVRTLTSGPGSVVAFLVPK